jgi:hypothetical protein
MTLMTIRLEMGRTEEYPEGNPELGYEFVVPLNPKGQIDADAWRHLKEKCWVRQIENGFVVQKGLVKHVGHGWRFDYQAGTRADDEPFFKLDRHVLAPGHYVSITEPDKVQRPFKVVSVTPVAQEAHS